MTFPPETLVDKNATTERECHGSTRGEALRSQMQIAPAEADNAMGLLTELVL